MKSLNKIQNLSEEERLKKASEIFVPAIVEYMKKKKGSKSPSLKIKDKSTIPIAS